MSQLSKKPDLARYLAERVVLRTKDVRQAIQVAKLCDTPEEVDRFEGGDERELHSGNAHSADD